MLIRKILRSIRYLPAEAYYVFRAEVKIVALIEAIWNQEGFDLA